MINSDHSHLFVYASQWSDNREPIVFIPTGPTQAAVKFLIDTGAQISMLNAQQAKDLGIQPSHKRIKISGVTGIPSVCHLATAKLWLPDDKRSTIVELALSPYLGTILGFDVLAGKRRYLPDGTLWSFGFYRVGAKGAKGQAMFVLMLCILL